MRADCREGARRLLRVRCLHSGDRHSRSRGCARAVEEAPGDAGTAVGSEDWVGEANAARVVGKLAGTEVSNASHRKHWASLTTFVLVLCISSHQYITIIFTPSENIHSLFGRHSQTSTRLSLDPGSLNLESGASVLRIMQLSNIIHPCNVCLPVSQVLPHPPLKD